MSEECKKMIYLNHQMYIDIGSEGCAHVETIDLDLSVEELHFLKA